MSNSPLVTYRCISPNKYIGRGGSQIDTVSIHCVVGQCSVETLGSVFAKRSRRASCNYGIGFDGRVALFVEERDTSMCTSSYANDKRSITIEVASDTKHPYAVTPKAYAALIDLLVDICRRNPGIGRLRWKGDKSLIGKTWLQNMTVHRWFANKACPGDWLYSRHGEIAENVNAILDGEMEENMNGRQILEKLTPEQCYAILKEAQAHEAKQPVPEWAEKELEEAVKLGITDGENPCELVPRYQAAVMALRAVKATRE